VQLSAPRYLAVPLPPCCRVAKRNACSFSSSRRPPLESSELCCAALAAGASRTERGCDSFRYKVASNFSHLQPRQGTQAIAACLVSLPLYGICKARLEGTPKPHSVAGGVFFCTFLMMGHMSIITLSPRVLDVTRAPMGKDLQSRCHYCFPSLPPLRGPLLHKTIQPYHC
jgi:hypothetical protein